MNWVIHSSVTLIFSLSLFNFFFKNFIFLTQSNCLQESQCWAWCWSQRSDFFLKIHFYWGILTHTNFHCATQYILRNIAITRSKKINIYIYYYLRTFLISLCHKSMPPREGKKWIAFFPPLGVSLSCPRISKKLHYAPRCVSSLLLFYKKLLETWSHCHIYQGFMLLL